MPTSEFYDSAIEMSDMQRTITTENSGPATADSVSLGQSGLNAPGSLRLTISSDMDELMGSEAGVFYSIREHPRVRTFLSVFSIVEIKSVKVFAYQSTVQAASSNGKAVWPVRFGIVPRGIPLKSGDLNITGLIPHLSAFVCGTNIAATAECTWGEGGLPFPPGLQLDLRALETRHNYPEVLLCKFVLDAAQTEYAVASATLSIELECRGQNFGSIY